MLMSSENKELDDSSRLLESMLTQVVKCQARLKVAAAVEQLQLRNAEFLYEGDDARQLRMHLQESIEGLEPEEIGEVVGVFNRYFSLLNISEESGNLKQRRLKAEMGGHYWPGSFHDTLLTLKNSGVTVDKLQTLLDELIYLPVLTAHPSEAKRRVVKGALRNVFVALEGISNNAIKGYFRKEALERLQCQIQLLWKTDEVRTRKLDVDDEIDAGLFFFPLSLFQATARVYRNFENSLRDVYGEDAAQQVHVPSFLQFGSWIGGDRDGNPNVTSQTTVLALRKQAQTIMNEYIRRLNGLLDQLSHSHGLVELPDAFAESLAADRDRIGPSVAEIEKRYTQEPYRCKLAFMKYRMECALTEIQQRMEGQPETPNNHAYRGVAEFMADLSLIDASLRGHGDEAIASHELHD